MSRLFGLSFRSTGVGLTVVEKKAWSTRVIATADEQLPEYGTDRDKAMADVIARWNKEHGPGIASVDLPFRFFTCKTVEMPVLSRNDLRNALLFELEKHLPLPVDEYLFDCAAREVVRDGKKLLHVMVLTIKKDVVEHYLKLFREAGVEVNAVRCSSLAVFSGTLERTGERRFGGIFVLDTDDSYEMIVADQGVPVMIKRIGRQDDIVAEIESVRDGRPCMVCSSGEGAHHIPDRLGCKKIVLQPAIGLAIASGKRSASALNFLPREFMKPKRDYYPIAIGALAAATAVVFFGTGIAGYAMGRYTLNHLLERVKTIKTQSAGLIENKKKLDQFLGERSVIHEFAVASNLPLRHFRLLSETLPDHSWIVSLSIDDKGKIEIEGVSKKTSDVIVALEKTGKFKDITFSAPITYKDGEERFSLKMGVEE